MTVKSKTLANSFSTGGGGGHFEAHVQASYVTLMLTGGYAPCLPSLPITKIKLQGKLEGSNTDDLIIFVENDDGKDQKQLLCQVKHAIRITKRNKIFGEVIKAAWDDFCNPNVFRKGKDKIALISCELTTTDTEDTSWVLDQARFTDTSTEFMKRVYETNFSSTRKQNKLEAFKEQLKKANNDRDLSNEELHDFLKHYYILGYDLGKEEGVVLSLIQSHISQFNKDYPKMVWGRIVDVVQTWDQNAGTITRENLPKDLIDEFRKPVMESIPKELLPPEPPKQIILPLKASSHDLAMAFLLGGWNESKDGDLQAANQLLNGHYEDWINSIRDALDEPGTPISLRNGIWNTKKSKETWEQLGKKVFDRDLDNFKEIAIEVLSERNPEFDLPPQERYMAGAVGKVLSYSDNLRIGVADALAVLGSHPEYFTHCSDNKADTITFLVVREVLSDASWIHWGGINRLLPYLAEASPDEFLKAVEKSLEADPCPFIKLFSEENNGIMGRNYMTGLLWALEALAWDEKYLARVSIILAELSDLDPGGNWANRPANSLTAIFLPWYPQSMATVEKRMIVVPTVVKEVPSIAWPFIFSLLPEQHQASSDTYRPKWRQDIPKSVRKGVTVEEYWNQVEFYSNLAFELAEKDVKKLVELTKSLDNFSPPILSKLLKYYESEEVLGLPEDEKSRLWASLKHLAVRHRKHADSDWALTENILVKIERVAEDLKPKDPQNLYRRLFRDDEFDLYEEGLDYDEAQRKLNERRKSAIGEVYKENGIESVLEFVEVVDSPLKVGTAFADFSTPDIDSILFPSLLTDSRDAFGRFLSSYIWRKSWPDNWDWVDAVISKDWGIEKLSMFLRNLPFCAETWDRVTNYLGGRESEYWSHVFINAYQAKANIETAVDKLLERGRPWAAIDCLHASYHKTKVLDHNRTIKALLSAANSDEPEFSREIFSAVEMIKALQEDEKTNQDDLFKIEWAYLDVLDGHWGARPETLEHRLATDPDFFCELIRFLYKSRHEERSPEEPSEKNRRIARQAYSLLRKWVIPPGTLSDGNFSEAEFEEWLQKVKSTCEETGHLEVALSQVGEVLYHVPPDPGGLWINKKVAEALNDKGAEKMRIGFARGISNSRGAHFVDPTGQPERDFAEKYSSQAEEAERAGYFRLAATMRNLADSYIREAGRIVADHLEEKDEDE